MARGVVRGRDVVEGFGGMSAEATSLLRRCWGRAGGEPRPAAAFSCRQGRSGAGSTEGGGPDGFAFL